MATAIDTALAGALAASSDPLIVEAIDYWRRIRPADLLPGRTHFDPVEVPRLLPYLGLLDVVREPRTRFKGRMAGTKVTAKLSVPRSRTQGSTVAAGRT